MKKGLLGILAVGIMTTAANAATLSMRFAGGGNEITLDASQSATIEVVITMGVNDGTKNPSRLTGLDSRFEVGDTVPGVGQDYVVDGSTKYTVTDVTSRPGWVTSASVLGPFNQLGFFLSTNDPTGVGVTGATIPSEFVVASFVIHKSSPVVAGDTYAVFRTGAALPALSNQGASWINRFGYGTETPGLRNQFIMGQGNPGDGNPIYDPYHGYETFRPLIIHNIPEPSSIALMVLGGLAALRRRS